MIDKLIILAVQLDSLTLKELRSRHPDSYDGPVKHASRADCIQAILQEFVDEYIRTTSDL